MAVSASRSSMVSCWPASADVPQRKPGDNAISVSSSLRKASHSSWSKGPEKLARRERGRAVGGRDRADVPGMRGIELFDQRLHRRVGLEQFGKYGQQPVAHVLDLA